MVFKKVVIRCILSMQMIMFGYMYIFGKNGLQILQKQKKELTALENNALYLQKEIDALESEIYVWQTNDFYKEKIAREQLQMARKKDHLFYIQS